MKISVKNVKHMASLSEETLCFTATVYADGKKIATASNRGHGGETEIHPTDGDHYWNSPELDKVREWVATLPDVVTDLGDKDEPFTYKQSLDGLVDDAVSYFLEERDMKKALKNKLLYSTPSALAEGSREFSFFGGANGIKRYGERMLREATLKATPNAVFLIDLPADKAVRAYRGESINL